ncbi:hypothetical protein M427DRAFT_140440 [Gonapodya prolifera JEL478]|uniref:Uncharacterized protein n=1 Tax=Gonapodya prolifera (strain JEL478) TaxID=1344416 RepID=A0A138ZZ52_GONPJ|nr:hypothetical protein M427DRAFT_140440 [Gonapodya prolifera JEL478]|eukprot:KXS09786.1 hypothetical protein M427DRAFT_140440 [Gonapodya prolifera JEL478]
MTLSVVEFRDDMMEMNCAAVARETWDALGTDKFPGVLLACTKCGFDRPLASFPSRKAAPNRGPIRPDEFSKLFCTECSRLAKPQAPKKPQPTILKRKCSVCQKEKPKEGVRIFPRDVSHLRVGC